MFNLNIFGKTKLLLACEYAMVVADVCKQKGMDITPELVDRLEEMILNEFPRNSSYRLAVEMLPNVLSVFETDASASQEPENHL